MVPGAGLEPGDLNTLSIHASCGAVIEFSAWTT
jgi:hypothetical protein